MPRPKAEDPKIAVTLRVRESVLKRYQMLGDDWREQMVQALIEHLNGPPAEVPEVKAARSRMIAAMTGAAPKRSPPAPKVDIQVGPVHAKPGERLKKR